MFGLGTLAFTVPWALIGLLVLPVIWWLLRIKPPAPARVSFPAILLLLRLKTHEESPVQTPLWLLILRLALAALIVLIAAHPLLDADSRLRGRGPLYVIIDDDWAAAAQWPARQAMLAGLADQAERDARPVAVVTTAPTAESESAGSVQLMPAADARRLFESLQPKPWTTRRAAAIERLVGREAFADERPGDVVWLSNSLEEVAEDGDGITDLLPSLQRLGATSVVADPPARFPVVLRPPVLEGEVLKVAGLRPSAKGDALLRIRAVAADGQLLAREGLVFEDGSRRAEIGFKLPTELLNRLARLEVEGLASAGSMVLLDERWRRRPVGLVSLGGTLSAQPLLDDTHYVTRALTPFTEIRKGEADELLRRDLAVVVMSDPGPIAKEVRDSLVQWMEKGGVVLRFAGPRLAQASDANDPLLPVRLRHGGRVIGGAMSWSKPESLAPFEELSPFFGLAIPDDVKVRRQVLAQPSLDLVEKTWARLSDGTPLVTAEKRERGWLVLVHTTANAEWSNLPLSGLFVDMLRRIVGLSQGVAATGAGPPLTPLETVDGFGRLGTPPASAIAVAAEAFDDQAVIPVHPPGYYGDGTSRRALNLSAGLAPPKPIGILPPGVERRAYDAAQATDLRPWLLGLAFLLLLIDMAASLVMRGLVRIGVATATVFGLAVLTAGAQAQSGDDAYSMGNSLETRLAFVMTGNAEVDETSEAGLTGLNVILKRRTAAELGPPQGVDPATDDLVFFPLIYWPMTSDHRLTSELAKSRINTYLRDGGTILFDTRDPDGGGASLAALARDLDIPPLVPVSDDHVLTRSFYLLKEFPGRWTGGTVWVERAGERINDGVSPVIAGAHDWAAAWAMDEAQRPLYPVVPGGERQREMAYRFGVNLVMYTLTGNYKADQVHLPAILKRLGQ